MSQTWPFSVIQVLHVLKRVVWADTKLPVTGRSSDYGSTISKANLMQESLPDGRELIAFCQGSTFKLEAIGIADDISEIGEQLAWLGSALHSSTYEAGVAVVNAFISDM
jgi:hypothetical protein